MKKRHNHACILNVQAHHHFASAYFSQDYPKLSQTYYVLLECLAQDHMSFLATMEPQVFLYILSSISEGLTALGGNLNYFTGITLQKAMIFYFPKIRIFYGFFQFSDTMVCTGCCATLDHIVTYLFKQVMMKGKKDKAIILYVLLLYSAERHKTLMITSL